VQAFFRALGGCQATLRHYHGCAAALLKSAPTKGLKVLMRFITCVVFATALTTFSIAAHAQRASENVVTSAQDAFGTTIGDDSIGLYGVTDARGFSPRDAGNTRIEGLFFDQQTMSLGFAGQLAQSTAMRVGLSAQSYPFPAPTGIADVRLRLPGDEVFIGGGTHVGPYGSYGGQLDAEVPIVRGKLGAVVGAAAGHTDINLGGGFEYVDYSGLLHWTPTDNAEVIAFYQRSNPQNGTGTQPAVLTSGDFVPPKFDRGNFFGPDFRQGRFRMMENMGVIGRSVVFGNWRLQAGLFRSTNDVKNFYFMLYSDTDQNGIATLNVRLRPPAFIGSYSGEVRASGQYAEGPRRHTFHFSAKGRSGKRTFGGDDTISVGLHPIGQRISIPRPTGFVLGPQSRDKVRHGQVGVSYVGQWSGVGELSVGVQKAFYRRTVDQFGPTLTDTRTNPWLYNATLAAQATEALTFYASYTRGLEDAGVAPESAANPGEALAASLTEQIDAGVRYRISPKVTLVAGVFQVDKPFFTRDAANVFARLGSLTHRGVEVSLSGNPIEGLTVVSGAVLLQARVKGAAVAQGLVAEVSPGQTPVLLKLNMNYGPEAWHGFSLNGQVIFGGSHYANRLNTFKVPSATVIDLGARYNFMVHDVSASVRFDVRNVTDTFGWNVAGASGLFTPGAPRVYVARLAAEY
jgi:iron complex outermembrane recepter protein